MKKLVFAGAILLSLIAVSCKKCKTCTTTVNQGGGFSQSTTTKKEYCGDDYNNAPAEGTTTQNVNGYTQESTTTCVEK